MISDHIVGFSSRTSFELQPDLVYAYKLVKFVSRIAANQIITCALAPSNVVDENSDLVFFVLGDAGRRS